MVNIANTSAIENGISDSNRCYASVVSRNFSEIETVVNSRLDSDNYAVSGVLSQHISVGGVFSAHISNSQVPSAKISQGGVVHDKLNFASADAGVKVLRIGASDSVGMPAYAPALARITKTFSLESQTTHEWNSIGISFSDAIDGDPLFTTTPVLCGKPIMQIAGAGIQTHELFAAKGNMGGKFMNVVGLNSKSCEIWFENEDADANSYQVTVHMAVIGANSG